MSQLIALVVGIVFLLVGISGYIPAVTTNYDTLAWAGHHSGALLFGLFQVSILHNIVHLAFGIAAIAMAGSVGSARAFLVGGGFVYLALWIYGLLIEQGCAANFVPVNTADNWLHRGLGVVMVALGLLTWRTTAHRQGALR
ncbi:DUF4383 domain-containing protein (plasmid) [Rhodococcus opacus]|uniref:DUF4383 domain-containing protein n=1 Tax=Rhodococcus opacus TaxID=37919 RepID=UPI0034D17F91